VWGRERRQGEGGRERRQGEGLATNLQDRRLSL
jgi:hypothetical protein